MGRCKDLHPKKIHRMPCYIKSGITWFGGQSGKHGTAHPYAWGFFLLAIIGITFVGSAVFLSASPTGSNSFTIGGDTPWTVTATLTGAGVGQPGGQQYIVNVGTYTSPSQIPPQLGSMPTDTSIDIDPDRLSNVKDGQLPEVLFGITRVWQTDQFGVRSNTYSESAPGGRLYYFMLQAYMKTTVSLGSEAVKGTYNAFLPWMATYENAMAQCSLWLKINIKPPAGVEVSNYTAQFGGASIYWGHSTTIPGCENKTIHYDDPAYVPSDVEINQAVSGLNDNLGAGGGSIQLQLTNKLQAGVRYNYGYPLGIGSYPYIENIANPINVGISYMVLFSMVLSGPPVQPDLLAQILQWIGDLFTVITNPSDPNWLVSVAIIVLVLVLVIYLVKPKKKKGGQGYAEQPATHRLEITLKQEKSEEKKS